MDYVLEPGSQCPRIQYDHAGVFVCVASSEYESCWDIESSSDQTQPRESLIGNNRSDDEARLTLTACRAVSHGYVSVPTTSLSNCATRTCATNEKLHKQSIRLTSLALLCVLNQRVDCMYEVSQVDKEVN